MIKKNFIKILLSIVFLILITLIILLITRVVTLSRENEKNKSIYCKMESDKEKMELYFDIKDGVAYRFTIVTEQPYKEELNIDNYNKFTNKSNQKYRGATSKVWHDNNTFITTDIFDINSLSEKEFKELLGMSKKELQKKTRKEIIDSIDIMGEVTDYFCE